ncbi:hypothetical protein RAS1_43250 [Phycisphaerae bacterium RAS1]|nr:hypothetical protein RAS1_43250 [Phycisphaerae bacterium RAS1]
MLHSGKLLLVGVLAVGAVCSGCTNATELLNPSFVEALGVTDQSVASLPDDAPAVLVAVENRTDRRITATLSWRGANDVTESFTFRRMFEGSRLAQAVVCPVTELTLGDVNNLDAVGVTVRLGDGGGNDPFVEVEPFGVLLKDDVNFNCGDAVTFVVQSSSTTRSGYQIVAYIQRARE